ncbi:MAG: hypothetical protein UU63_C0006G0016 [Candidatus Uhrbacteria bacterium GW2011_GWF2_41_430]|nr:MAG: hypothetical protein UU63_C0006G0016 [Candidatus Uhrbacteria bacterium GW2011_GWF2_41_430]
MYIEELDTTTPEGKLLSVALSRLLQLYPDKNRQQILDELLKVCNSFEWSA